MTPEAAHRAAESAYTEKLFELRLAEAWDAGAAASDDYARKYRVAFDFGDELPEPPDNPHR